jgi:hypothetical protein
LLDKKSYRFNLRYNCDFEKLYMIYLIPQVVCAQPWLPCTQLPRSQGQQDNAGCSILLIALPLTIPMSPISFQNLNSNSFPLDGGRSGPTRTGIDVSHITYNPNSGTTPFQQNGLQAACRPMGQKFFSQVIRSWTLDIICWTLGAGCVVG